MEAKTAILVTDECAYVATYAGQKAGQPHSLLRLDVPAPLHPRSADLADYGRSLSQCVLQARSDLRAAQLIVPATWCYLRVLTLPDERCSDQMLRFAIEECLPVDLERLTCAFVRRESGTAFAAAAETEPICEFIAACEREGMLIESIVPDLSLLSPPPGRACVLLDRTRFGLIARSSSVISARSGILPPDNPKPILAHHLKLTQSTSGIEAHQIQVLSLTDVSCPGPTSVCSSSSTPPAVEQLLNNALAADRLLDLRTGPLAYAGRWKGLNQRAERCLASLCVLLLISALAFRMHAWEYMGASEKLRPARDELYATVFPGSQAPPGAAMRLRSERLKLTGLTNQEASDATLSTGGLAALEILHLLNANMPQDIKLFVTEIVLEPTEVRFAGQTTTHEAAGNLIQALNQVSSLEVEPPRTKLRADKTIDFRLVARLRNEAGNAENGDDQ